MYFQLITMITIDTFALSGTQPTRVNPCRVNSNRKNSYFWKKKGTWARAMFR